MYADFLVIKLSHRLSQLGVLISRDFLRQIIHYLFHNVLRYLIARIRKIEERLRRVMHANKVLAKNVEREGMVRSKLEEVALHKVAHALTEEEKRKVKEKTLNGM